MQQRYYDPQIGRFLSTDPAASEFNRYSYASNNPYRFIDPDGRVAMGGGSNMGPQNFNADGDYSMAISTYTPAGDGAYSQGQIHILEKIFGREPGGPGKGWNTSNMTPVQKLYMAAVVAKQNKINLAGISFGYNRSPTAVNATMLTSGLVWLPQSAFSTRSLLAATLGHEIEVHWWGQIVPDNYHLPGTNIGRYRNEAAAYLYNIQNADRFHNSKAEVADFRSQYITYYYNGYGAYPDD